MQVAVELVASLSSDPDVGHRALSSVLLRRLIEQPAKAPDGSVVGRWRLFSPDVIARIKDGLLQALTREPEKHIRHKLSHTIAEAALSGAGAGGAEWPALLPAVFTLARSADAAMREAGLHVFTKLCDYAGNTVLVPHISQLHPVLVGLLGDAENKVRVAALDAVISLLKHTESDAQRAAFQAQLPQMFKVLELSLAADELQAREALESLIELVEDHPTFIRPYVQAVADAMLRIFQHSGFDAETRMLALEFVLQVK
jgi:importin-4